MYAAQNKTTLLEHLVEHCTLPHVVLVPEVVHLDLEPNFGKYDATASMPSGTSVQSFRTSNSKNFGGLVLGCIEAFIDLICHSDTKDKGG